jgi:transposase-like protein
MKDITEEQIISSMVQHDIVVKMPPKKKYTLKVKEFRVRKAEPKILLG